ncbi:MAG: DUF1127 domain-containing protein [Pseudomonadota bacterium]
MSLFSGDNSVGTAFSKRRQFRRAVRVLRQLDDHQLGDIGVTRGTIEDEARKLVYGR